MVIIHLDLDEFLRATPGRIVYVQNALETESADHRLHSTTATIGETLRVRGYKYSVITLTAAPDEGGGLVHAARLLVEGFGGIAEQNAEAMRGRAQEALDRVTRAVGEAGKEVKEGLIAETGLLDELRKHITHHRLWAPPGKDDSSRDWRKPLEDYPV